MTGPAIIPVAETVEGYPVSYDGQTYILRGKKYFVIYATINGVPRDTGFLLPEDKMTPDAVRRPFLKQAVEAFLIRIGKMT